MKPRRKLRYSLVLFSTLILVGVEMSPVVSLAAETLPTSQLAESQVSEPTTTSTETTETSTETTTETTSTSTETTTTSSSSETESSSSTSESSSSTETSSTTKPSTSSEQPVPEKPQPESSKEAVTTETTVSTVETKPETAKPVPTGSAGKTNESLGEASISLDAALKIANLTQSNLKGFELPLLASFKDKNRAVLIAEALKGIDKTAKDLEITATTFDTPAFLTATYQKLFATNVGKTLSEQATSGKRLTIEEAQPGDLLFWESAGHVQKNALYLGQGKYVTVTTEAKDQKRQTLQLFDFYESSDSKETKNGLPTFAVTQTKDLKLTEYGEKVLKTYGASYDFKKNEQTEAFVQKIGEAARELGGDYDVFASVMIAQAILESGSGSSQLASGPNYNLFGIKGNFQGKSVNFATSEESQSGQAYTITADFRQYSSYKDSLMDYVQLLRQGISGNKDFYQPAWRSKAKNYLQTTAFLTGKYATDTQYNNKLNSLIATYNLTRFDLPKAEAGIIIQSKTDIPKAYQEKLLYPVYDGINYNRSGSYPTGQCTWYVYNRFKQLGKNVDEFMGNGSDWGTKGANLGYKVSQIPTVGSAISFQPGVAGSDKQYGHVAFVEAITSEGILISESNVVNDQTISYRVLGNDVAYSSGVSYITGK